MKIELTKVIENCNNFIDVDGFSFSSFCENCTLDECDFEKCTKS